MLPLPPPPPDVAKLLGAELDRFGHPLTADPLPAAFLTFGEGVLDVLNSLFEVGWLPPPKVPFIAAGS
jgi:hypothetical protein